ncbi:MAG: ATP-binding protein, partial [Solirubrobacteraceae bacterium]
VGLFVSDQRFTVTVADRGAGIPPGSPAMDGGQGIGLTLMRTLAQDLSLRPAPEGGTQVRMEFAANRDGHRLFQALSPASPDGELGVPGEDEVVVSLSPVALLPGVLGRLARTLAATAHFSLDRFSDIYLITDTLAAHAASAADSGRIEARLTARDRRLELLVGPFRAGTGSRLDIGGADHPASPLVLLSDDVSVQQAGDAEQLRVVVIDHRR